MGETRYENSPQPDRLSGFTCPAPVYLSLQQSTFWSETTNYIHIRAHMPQLLQHHFVPHLCHTDAGQVLHVVQRTSPSKHTTNQSCDGKKTEAQQGGHTKNTGEKKKKSIVCIILFGYYALVTSICFYILLIMNGVSAQQEPLARACNALLLPKFQQLHIQFSVVQLKYVT